MKNYTFNIDIKILPSFVVESNIGWLIIKRNESYPKPAKSWGPLPFSFYVLRRIFCAIGHEKSTGCFMKCTMWIARTSVRGKFPWKVKSCLKLNVSIRLKRGSPLLNIRNIFFCFFLRSDIIVCAYVCVITIYRILWYYVTKFQKKFLDNHKQLYSWYINLLSNYSIIILIY